MLLQKTLLRFDERPLTQSCDAQIRLVVNVRVVEKDPIQIRIYEVSDSWVLHSKKKTDDCQNIAQEISRIKHHNENDE